MRIRLNNPDTARDLVRFLRRRGYLAVAEPRAVVEAVPINTVSEQADRSRLLQDLSAWMAENPGLEATLVED
jgi:hypothetical protein